MAGHRRKAGDSNDALTLIHDPALDDQRLAEVRDEVTRRRWQPLRDLFADTGLDWDRRTHRMQVLAAAAAEYRTVEDWCRNAPGSVDAHVLRAYVEVARAFQAAGSGVDTERALTRASTACLDASDRYPSDPVPWVALLTLARLLPQGGDPDFWRWWRRLQACDQFNREAHHQTLTHLFARCHGSHSEMYSFATDTAARAPDGSPLHVLPLVAHSEYYRALRSGSDPTITRRGGHVGHWSGEDGRRYVDRAVNGWHWRAGGHAQAMVDRNYLAHGLVHVGRFDEAAEVFQAIGPYATRVPWAFHGDPAQTFLHWRSRLLPGRD